MQMRGNYGVLLAFVLVLGLMLPVAAQQTARMHLGSTGFADGASIPDTFTCAGEDMSPPLIWTGVPVQAKSLAIIVKDPDAPGGTFVHWVLYNLPVNGAGLSENVPQTSSGPSGALQGINGFGKLGYGGPCPPQGSLHHYHFVLYALDRVLEVGPGASAAQVESSAAGHVLSTAELIGVFQR